MERIKTLAALLAFGLAAGTAGAQAIGHGDSPSYPAAGDSGVVGAPAAAAAFSGGPGVAASSGAEPDEIVKGDALVSNPAFQARAGRSRAEVRAEALRADGDGGWERNAYYVR